MLQIKFYDFNNDIKPSFTLLTFNVVLIKGVCFDHIWILPSKWSFLYEMKATIFLIMPVKFYDRQMLLVKVISENVATVR